jgi:hypothetical protein
MAFTTIQPSFSGGELAPSLHARVDLAKYATGLKRCHNFYVHAHGGISNRPGFEYIGPTTDDTRLTRLIAFSFNTEQTYALEFSHLTLRIIMDGGHVLETPVAISGASQANPAVITATSHGYANGDDVYISGITGMSELNGRSFTVAGVTTNTFQLSGCDSTTYTAYASGGLVARYYTVVTPYLETELAELKFTQSADVMTMCHPNHAPRELGRTGHAAWALNTIVFGPSIDAPASVTVAPQGTTGAEEYKYKITSVADETLEESLPVEGTDSTGHATLDKTNFNRVTWPSVTEAVQYNVYRYDNGLYGYIGTTETEQFDDTGITPALNDTPPKDRTPFSGTGDYPSCVTYYQQRRIFGGTLNSPQTVYGTQIGNQANMNVSSPLKDDDAITFTLAAQQVNEIRHLVPLNELIVSTSGGEWKMSGGVDDVVTPTNVAMKVQGYRGAAHVNPIVSGNTILFVQEKGSIVRDLAYSFESDGYTGNNLSVLAGHLFDGKYIKEWAYAQVPQSTVWAVRDDGILLGLTYLREHEVWAWHWHDTDGLFESVCTISEGSEDAVYVVVKRNIGGQTRRYIERLHSRVFQDIRDAFFVDSGLTYDSPVVVSNATQASPVVVTTAVAHGFANGDVIDFSDIESGMTEINDNRYVAANVTSTTFQLTDYDTGSNIDGTAFGTFDTDLGGNCREALSVFSGLDHIEGKTVSILADGNDMTPQVVTNGSIALVQPASRVHIGLAFTSDIETLNIEAGNQGTAQGKLKAISEVTMRVEKTRGLWAGPSEENLTEIKQRTDERYGDAIRMTTGDINITLVPEWNKNGRLFVQQSRPLPATILAVVPKVAIGG